MTLQAACHVHSEWSYDGRWTLKAIAAEFARRGYRVLLMTEHDRGFSTARWNEYRGACSEASSEKILIVPGMEYSDASNTIHVLTWGVAPFLGESIPTKTILQLVRETGGVSVLAHPSRRNAWRQFDPSWSELLLGVEVWNRKTDGWRPSPNAPSLLQTSRTVPFVGMDFHDRHQLFPLGMRLELDKPTEREVIDCLRARRCSPCAFGASLTPGRARALRSLLAPFEFARRSLSWTYRNLKSPKTGRMYRPMPHS